MTFAVGDEVLILADSPPGIWSPIPKGAIGKIEAIHSARSTRINYSVEGSPESWLFYPEDFEVIKYDHSMPEPEFDLEDMELAEIIMEEMK